MTSAMRSTVDADSCTPGLVVRVHDEYTGVVDKVRATDAVLLVKRGWAFVPFDALTVTPEEEVPDWARELQAQVQARYV